MRKQKALARITLEDLQIPVFEGVDKWVLEGFVAQGETREFEAGYIILEEDKPANTFWVLIKGSVRIFYIGPDGTEVVVKIFGAPAVFGEMECLTDIPWLENVDAVERAVLLAVPRKVFIDAAAQSAAFSRNMMVDLAARLCISAQNERSLAFNTVETRLANLMETYVDFYGVPVEGGKKIRIPLSQEDLANALGVNRKSITRTLKKWTEESILGKEGKYYIVQDEAALEKIKDPNLLRIGYRPGDVLKKIKK